MKNDFPSMGQIWLASQLPCLNQPLKGQEVPKAATPIAITLTADEAAEILTPIGTGGQQTFQQELIKQLQNGNLVVHLNDDELGRLIRYMTQYGTGGFQSRLRRAFQRPLRDLFAA